MAKATMMVLMALNNLASSAEPTTILIAPGVEMPLVNFGGVSGEPSNYSDVLASGGHGLDTALAYGDKIQKEVGAAVKQAVAGGMSRKNIFVTTKVPCCPNDCWVAEHHPLNWMCNEPENERPTEVNVDADIGFLGPVDLMLLHWPCVTMEQNLAAYKVLEAALAAGKTRAIGVSNFNASLLAEFLPKVSVKPAVNQCSHAVGSNNAQHDPAIGGDNVTAAFCKAHGISYSAWSPLGGLDGIDIFKNPTVIKIGVAHNVSAAQVALRWLVQQGISVVTAADKHEYIVEDMDLFSFALTPTEMATLAAI